MSLNLIIPSGPEPMDQSPTEADRANYLWMQLIKGFASSFVVKADLPDPRSSFLFYVLSVP